MEAKIVHYDMEAARKVAHDKLKAENKRLRDGLRDMSNYGRTYGGQKCADIAYEMLTGEKPDVSERTENDRS